MSTPTGLFKIQRVRSCVQCGDLLPLKCAKCVKHPARKPRIIELYEWPEILETAPCGCFKIACMLPGCTKTMWRIRKFKHGLAEQKHFFCEQRHAQRFHAQQKRNSVVVACEECKTRIERIPAKIKARMFCKPECWYIYQKRKQAEAKAGQQIIAKALDRHEMLTCRRCREITEHKPVLRGISECLACGEKRNSQIVMRDSSR